MTKDIYNIFNVKDPIVTKKAKSIEKQIFVLLRDLINSKYPSCLQKEFRIKWNNILNLFDKYQKEILSCYPLKVTCKKNCGICCNHWPEDTYSFEVIYIAEYLKKQRKSEIEKIKNILRDDILCLKNIKKTIKKKFEALKVSQTYKNIDLYDVALFSFYQFNRPCPLLDKNGSCSIYKIRPLTCRVYVSFSPPKYCSPNRILGNKTLTFLLDIKKEPYNLFDRLNFMYDFFDGNTAFREMLYHALTK
jgi:Fe-S-cluster containining protein